jgi:putative redox protein
MQVKVQYKEHLQFEATARGHRMLTDQPLDNEGDDLGMTPPEWFLASIGGCIGFYAVKYCQTRGLDATGLSVDVSAQKTTDMPVRLDDIKVQVNVPIDLDEHQYQGLERAVDACLIHKTLTNPPYTDIQINTPSRAAINSIGVELSPSVHSQ